MLSKWKPSNDCFYFLYKMLDKHLWNSFSLYLLVGILQVAHETSSFSEVLYKKKVFWKASQNSQINTRTVIRRCSVKRFVLKIWQTEKHLCSFLIKLQTGNLKLPEAATGDVQLNKVFLKISQISLASLFNKVAVLRACNFIKKDSDTYSAFLWNLQNF